MSLTRRESNVSISLYASNKNTVWIFYIRLPLLWLQHSSLRLLPKLWL